MSDVSIDIQTTTISPVISVEQNVTEVEINAEVTNRNTTIEVEKISRDVTIEVQEKEIKVVTIEVERGVVHNATDSLSGIMKLYSSLGQNTDGSVSQKEITDNLELKVEKVTGYSLTKNDLTDSLKTAYDNVANWISTNGTNLINHLSNSSNPHEVDKEDVGLGNVPNTDFTDAIEGKVDKIDDYELVGISHLIHRTRMSIRQDDMNMKLILK
tara:strand:+ start:4497 stop:5135 length:639 start_codon:yes stop_codon:yes gene_type:complete